MIDREQIYKWWSVFHSEGEVTEIRSFNSKGDIYSGYYKDIDNIIRDIQWLDSKNDFQIYFVINAIKDDCYSRVQQEKIAYKPKTTNDTDIVGRKWIMIDLDPKRTSGISSSNEELEFAHQKALEVYRYLKNNGFNEPVVCMSGSGYHLMYSCRLAVAKETDILIERFLKSLSMIFSDEKVEVDTTCKNTARLSKVYGTMARKGANSAERPHRISRIIKVPDEIKINDIEYIKKIADLYPEDKPKPSSDNNWGQGKFDVEAFLNKHNIHYHLENHGEDKKFVLDHCVFDENHKGKDAVIFQRKEGGLAYVCLHNSCSNYTWKDFRLKYEPDAYDKKDLSNFMFKFQKNQKQVKTYEPIKQTDEKGNLWLKMSDIKKPTLDIQDYIPSGIPQIDNLIIGFKRKHCSLWSGYRGSAKSSILNMFILNAAQNGYKTALWTGELDGSEVKQWLYLQAAGKSNNRKSNYNDYYYTPTHICEKIDTWIDNYLWLFNNEYGENFKQIEDEIRKLKEEQDIDMVILDSLMVLDYDDLDGDKNEKQKNVMRILTKLAKNLNIHIHIVAHPNKSGNFLRPNNISGSGHIPDLAQNIFILHRLGLDFTNNAKDFLPFSKIDDITKSGCTNVIEICKCRDKGSAVDSFIKLYFEIESNRLKNDIAEHIIYGWEEQYEQGEISYIQPNASFIPQPVKIEEPTPPPLRTKDFSSYIPKEYIEPQMPNDYDDDCPF